MNPNVVLHFREGSHDKVYIATVRERVDSEEERVIYEVLGKWGRRGGLLSEQVKEICHTVEQALITRDTLVKSKIGKGYVDVASSDYRGPVSALTVGIHLEPDLPGVGVSWKTPESGSRTVTHVGGKKETIPANPFPKRDSLIPTSAPFESKETAIPSKSKKPTVLVGLCVDNTGMEYHFDRDVEYLVAESTDKDGFMTVFDRYAGAVEVSKGRFKLRVEESEGAQ